MKEKPIEIKQLKGLYDEVDKIVTQLDWFSPCDDSEDWDANEGYVEFTWGLRDDLNDLLNKAYNLGGAYTSEI